MRLFKSRWFTKFARKERITDAILCSIVAEAEHGLIDADYGGGVIKKRIARPGEGKSGGYRSIILFRRRHRSFFVYGFAKNEQANIDESDERDFKDLAEILLEASEGDLNRLVDRGEYVEVNCNA
jgi:hypothetical protein